MFAADDAGETFDRIFKTIAKHKPKGRPGWALLACMVLAGGAHSAPYTALKACPPQPANRVQGVLVPKTASPRARAAPQAKPKCMMAGGSPIFVVPDSASKPK